MGRWCWKEGILGHECLWLLDVLASKQHTLRRDDDEAALSAAARVLRVAGCKSSEPGKRPSIVSFFTTRFLTKCILWISVWSRRRVREERKEKLNLLVLEPSLW